MGTMASQVGSDRYRQHMKRWVLLVSGFLLRLQTANPGILSHEVKGEGVLTQGHKRRGVFCCCAATAVLYTCCSSTATCRKVVAQPHCARLLNLLGATSVWSRHFVVTSLSLR